MHNVQHFNQVHMHVRPRCKSQSARVKPNLSLHADIRCLQPERHHSAVKDTLHISGRCGAGLKMKVIDNDDQPGKVFLDVL